MPPAVSNDEKPASLGVFRQLRTDEPAEFGAGFGARTGEYVAVVVCAVVDEGEKKCVPSSMSEPAMETVESLRDLIPEPRGGSDSVDRSCELHDDIFIL